MKTRTRHEIQPGSLPFSLDDKIFQCTDPETGDVIGEPYSYNDFMQSIEDLSGVNEELMGSNAHKS